MSAAFDWTDKALVIVPEQLALAVYRNGSGQVVIRQSPWPGERDDTFIVFAPEHAVALAYAVLEGAGLPMEIIEITERGYCDVERPDRGSCVSIAKPKPKDSTAAQRMRRYRNKHRNGNRNADRNADRNAVTQGSQQKLIAAE